ncbi:hypothetical protein MMC07_001836 [Pseudocyphellaria aurata]|nr:hypothetical protein [Pseudocyphellaria aurata]
MTFLLALTSLSALVLLLYKYFLLPALFSPLSKIPSAHFTAPFSPAWMLWVRSRYKENQTIHAAHQKFGPIVRLGPNEVSVNCVDGGIRTVYSGGFEKAEWYSNLFYNYNGSYYIPPSEESPAKKIAAKRMITNIYSKSYIQSSSDMRELSLEILFNRFLPIIETSIAEKTTVEALDLNLASSMDFMNAYIFGLASGSDFLRDVKTRQRFLDLYQSRKPYIFWPAELPWLLSFLSRFKRILTPQWIDAANDALENWCFQMCNAAKSSSEPGSVTKETPFTNPVVYNQLSQSLLSSSASTLEHQTAIASEVLDQGGAGHETSGIALTYYMHELSQRPALQSAIRSECLTLSPPLLYPSTMPSLPSPRALDALPLLHATLIETLRLHAPIPGPQPRVTPSTPTSLANSPPLPGGVRVSANAHSLHRNPDVFPNPEEWRPERWLEGSKANRDEMMRWFWAFGSGGRMCIGSNFAMQQMKFIIAAVYTNYTTHIIDDAAIEQQDAYTALPRGNLLLRFQRVADK